MVTARSVHAMSRTRSGRKSAMIMKGAARELLRTTATIIMILKQGCSVLVRLVGDTPTRSLTTAL
jgi:hypothetical protein